MTWKQMRFAANALLVTMAAVACSSSDPSDARLCSTDEDCGESYICESNICVPDSTPGDECLNGLIVDDVCVPCENGTTLQSGECKPCPNGTEYVDGLCKPKTTDPNLPGYGDPCADLQCAPGLTCVSTTEGRVCTHRCDITRPVETCEGVEDWECRLLDLGGGDLTAVCVPNPQVLCRACDPARGAADCEGAMNHCTSFHDGNFCSRDCSSSSCPDGYECTDVTMDDLSTAKQCFPVTGFCKDCIDYDQDGYGEGSACLGLDCNDQDPTINAGAYDICDGVDNNCDGVIDDLWQTDGVYGSVENCGICGRNCNAMDDVGSALCDISGAFPVCKIVECAPGTFDNDGNPLNGCEYTCQKISDIDNTCDGIDDDCDGQIDEDFDFANDDNNCGVCGTVCGMLGSGTITSCQQGTCKLSTCADNYADCDNDGITCETDLRTPSNCGACGTSCGNLNTTSNACVEVNSEFVCDIQCKPGFSNCDGIDSNGCEAQLNNDPMNCGGCGIRCEYDNGTGVCMNGTCQLLSCNDDYFDCNADGTLPPANSDGCEAYAGNIDSCGGCGIVCSNNNVNPLVPAECRADAQGDFSCFQICANNFDNCDGNPNNGCEVDLRSNLDNCGTCGSSCQYDNADMACMNGMCRFDGCHEGFGDCNSDMLAIIPPNGNQDGCELNMVNDEDNCGGCGVLCNPPGSNAVAYCDVDVCVQTACNPGFGECGPGGSCVSLNTTEFCGNCNTNCYNPPNPAAHGHQIRTANCTGSGCTIALCETNYLDCDGAWATGCETALRSNTSCGNGCGIGQLQNCTTTFPNAGGTCSAAGSCEIGTCETGYFNVDNNNANGCECRFDSATDVPETSAPFKDQNCDGIDGDVSKSIFVAKWGADNASCGTRTAPCATIKQGIARASTSQPNVLVGGGEYVMSETLVLKNGINIYGGYAATAAENWARTTASTVTIRVTTVATSGSRLVGVSGSGISATTKLANVVITTQATNATGVSNIGLYCSNCGGLSVEQVTVNVGGAGNGAAGNAGVSGAARAGTAYPTQGGNGGGGSCDNEGCQYGVGGSAGQGASAACAGGSEAIHGGYGGNGGTGSCSGRSKSGQAGGSVDGVSGGAGGAAGAPGRQGGDGTNGRNGNGGSNGAEATRVALVNGWPVAGSGGKGAEGEFGRGGTGGGGGGRQQNEGWKVVDDGAGNGGGGGGAGGCGGEGGYGGTGGGHVIGFYFANGGTPEVRNSIINSDRAGNGGAGGTGGAGQGGRPGGFGGATCTDEVRRGGNGGAGGTGGAGGRGAGGAGGSSYGVVLALSTQATRIQQATIEFNTGSPGDGGVGGNNGPAGERVNVKTF